MAAWGLLQHTFGLKYPHTGADIIYMYVQKEYYYMYTFDIKRTLHTQTSSIERVEVLRYTYTALRNPRDHIGFLPVASV